MTSQTAERRVSVSASCRHDPFSGLTGHGGDQVEVGVVVEHREASRFCRRCDDQVGGGSTPVPAPLGQRFLDSVSPIEGGLVDGGEWLGRPCLAEAPMVGSAPGAEACLEVGRGAACHQTGLDEGNEAFADSRFAQQGHGRCIGQVVGP